MRSDDFSGCVHTAPATATHDGCPQRTMLCPLQLCENGTRRCWPGLQGRPLPQRGQLSLTTAFPRHPRRLTRACTEQRANTVRLCVSLIAEYLFNTLSSPLAFCFCDGKTSLLVSNSRREVFVSWGQSFPLKLVERVGLLGSFPSTWQTGTESRKKRGHDSGC